MNKTRFFTAIALALLSANVFAAGGGNAMPWDQGINAIVGNITGPTAGAIALLGIAVGGMGLLFGQDINAFGRVIFVIVLVVGIVVGAAAILNTLGVAGAQFDEHDMQDLIVIRSQS